MGKYSVEMVKDGATKYYYIINSETLDIELFPTKYLTHKTKSNRSPNTVRRCAFSLTHYMNYLDSKQMRITDVYKFEFTEQSEFFVEFLYWLKAGNHKSIEMEKLPNNKTCNAYLKDVFGFYLFIETEYDQFGSLKVLVYNQYITANSVGVKKKIRFRGFKGYLKEEEHTGKTAEKDQIIEILQACTNIRDQLLILMMAETGFRIGEILGIDYIQDIDYDNRLIKVSFRDDNENSARAKNAEYRKARLSQDTFEILQIYISEYAKLLQHQKYLFINIAGNTAGKPLQVDAVYSMFHRMEEKTGIKMTPHRLRHYFGNERRKAGWALELIQVAYGHKHLQTTVNYLNYVDDQLLDASREFYEKHSALYGIDKVL